MTFNDWRRANGYKLEKMSVPQSDLNEYCFNCGWPTKKNWITIFGLSGFSLDEEQYTLWLKFIGVLDEDRPPLDSAQVAEYALNLNNKSNNMDEHPKR